MRRVLITGGAGFVGRHFCRHYLESGDQVVCVDSIAAQTGGKNPAAGWPLFDPRDYGNFLFAHQDCREYFDTHPQEQFDLVVHLAALVGGRAIIEDYPLAVADDLSIDAAYWQWAYKARPAKTLCFSSSAAYPVKYQRREGHRLLTEDMISFGDDIGMPDMSYGWAKLTCEYLARLAWEKHGLKSVCYRPFSGYGEDQDDAYPFPSICRRVLANRGQSVVKVWGTGDQMRDFIHIDDCVRGAVIAEEKIHDGSAVNLSTGILTSFKEFVSTAARLLGWTPVVEGTSNTPEGCFARGGDVSLQRKLGFRHDVTFEDGIRRALAYFEAK